MRIGKPSREYYTDKLERLQNELRECERLMDVARKANTLDTYEHARLKADLVMDEIGDIVSILHPMLPSHWFDKYGYYGGKNQFTDADKKVGE